MESLDLSTVCLSLTSGVCHVLVLLVMTLEASTVDVDNFFLKGQSDVAWPSGLTDCQLTLEASRLACVRRCVSTPTCLSMYLELDNALTGPHRWKCQTCQTAVSTDTLVTGTGYYAVVKKKNLGLSPPVLAKGVLVKTDILNGAEAAYYDCTKIFFIKLRLARDVETGLWPQLNLACRNTICTKASLSTTLTRVTFDATGFVLQPHCLTGETTDGSSRCDYDGTWTVTSASGVHCISSTCYRKNASWRSFYKGNKRTTNTGITCQYWSTTFPHWHALNDNSRFIVDGYSYIDALNYCRDPDNSGAPWCYTVTTIRWRYCGIPLCQ